MNYTVVTEEKENTKMTTIKLNQLLSYTNTTSLHEVLSQYQEDFIDTYQFADVLNEVVILKFETTRDAQAFYTDCTYGNRLLRNVNVSYDTHDETKLILRPIPSIISLVKSSDSPLRVISSKLHLNFTLEYTQAITNHHLHLTIHNGEVINPECTLYINMDYLSLAFGRLYKLMSKDEDFVKLNTQIEIIRSQPLS